MSRRDEAEIERQRIAEVEARGRLNEPDEYWYLIMPESLIWIARTRRGMGEGITRNTLVRETAKKLRVRGPLWGFSNDGEFLIDKDGNVTSGFPFRSEAEAVQFMLTRLETRRLTLLEEFQKTETKLKIYRRRFSEIESTLGDNSNSKQETKK